MSRCILEYFYPDIGITDSEIPRLLDSLPAWVYGYIKASFMKACSLTLDILKSQSPNAVLDVAADGWAATVDRERTEQLMDNFRKARCRLARMLSTKPEHDSEL